MGRGYWLPPAYENLAACDGFYIEAEAVYTGDPYDDWEKFINTLSVKLSYREKTLEKYAHGNPAAPAKAGMWYCETGMWTLSRTTPTVMWLCTP